jgi:hypothetical protein
MTIRVRAAERASRALARRTAPRAVLGLLPRLHRHAAGAENGARNEASAEALQPNSLMGAPRRLKP